MSKIKLLTISVIALILINIATLAFFFFKGPRPMGKKNPKEIVIEKLHFDENQVASYDALINIHSEEVKSLNDAILKTKNNLYSELSKTDNKTVIDSLLMQLATQQGEIEKTHFNHFLAIKKICKPEQIEDYNALTKELSKIFSPKLPPNEMNREHEHRP